MSAALLRSRAPVRVVAPVTPRVPEITVLPDAEATVNLSAPAEVLTAKLPSTSTVLLNSDAPVTVTVPPRVVLPSTFRVLSKSAAPLPFNVPSITVLPEEEATVNLSVVPLLTAKFASTSTVPLNSEFPATVKVPSTDVLPEAATTLNLSVLTLKLPVTSTTPPNDALPVVD